MSEKEPIYIHVREDDVMREGDETWYSLAKKWVALDRQWFGLSVMSFDVVRRQIPESVIVKGTVCDYCVYVDVLGDMCSGCCEDFDQFEGKTLIDIEKVV